MEGLQHLVESLVDSVQSLAYLIVLTPRCDSGPQKTVSGAQEIFAIANSHEKYSWAQITFFGAIYAQALTFLLWLIFAIFGVSTFKGRFSRCNDDLGVHGTSTCVGSFANANAAANGIAIHGREWSNPPVHFDNIGSALYALYEVSTLDKWLYVAHGSMDMPFEIGLQPSVDNQPFWCFYYILFIVVSNFFLLNLFVGTVYEKYVRIRDLGVEDLTKPQHQWMLIMEHIAEIAPHRGNRHQNFKLSLLKRVGKFRRGGAEAFVESKLFEEILIFTIVFNCVIMALTYHGEPECKRYRVRTYIPLLRLFLMGVVHDSCRVDIYTNSVQPDLPYRFHYRVYYKNIGVRSTCIFRRQLELF
jgi:hypothetical protein